VQQAVRVAQSPLLSGATSSFTRVCGGVLAWLLHAVYFENKDTILKNLEEAELLIFFFLLVPLQQGLR